MAKFNIKTKAIYVGLQAASGAGFKIETGAGTITGVTATIGSTPVFTCTADNIYVGQAITLTGSNTGALITGYSAGNVYYVISISTVTTGVTGFVLSATRGGTSVVTTGTGGSTGLTFTTASLRSDEAIACTEITFDPTRETGSYAYLGDSLSRDETTYEKDKYVNLSVTSPQQRLVDMVNAIDPNTASIWKLLQACGGNISVNATTKEVSAGNNIESPDYVTADFRMSTPDDLTNDKVYKFWDMRGIVDINLSVGELPTLKFNLMGNIDAPVAATKQVANLGSQTTRASVSVFRENMQQAQIILVDDAFTNAVGTVSTATYTADGKFVVTFSAPHSLTIGSALAIQVAGVTNATDANGTNIAVVQDATKLFFFVKGLNSSNTATGSITVKKGDTAPAAFCFSNLNCTNFFGFELTRFQTSCETGFDRGATATDVSVTMLEDQVGATAFDPVSNVGKFFGVYVKVGTGVAGHNTAYLWDKLQLANYKKATIGNSEGFDVPFRNTGQSYMLWS